MLFTQTLALGADTMVQAQAQQNTLGRYTRRITVNVIEAYYILQEHYNVII